jgi:hypothetical protein
MKSFDILLYSSHFLCARQRKCAKKARAPTPTALRTDAERQTADPHLWRTPSLWMFLNIFRLSVYLQKVEKKNLFSHARGLLSHSSSNPHPVNCKIPTNIEDSGHGIRH